MALLGLLNLPITDSKSLYERHQQHKRRGQTNIFRSWMYIKIPFWNPDAFLDRTMPWMRPLFTRSFVAMWLACLAVALGLVIHRFDEFTSPLGNLLALNNLPFLWVALFGLKLWHELGHGYACKNFGGRVPDMGMMLFFLNPCAYVDASASWGFPRTRDRLIVSLGGMYFESMIACAALFVWAFAGDSMIASRAHHVVVMSGFVTLLFNANPLMRYDGYYILADLVGIPNMRSKSQLEMRRHLKRWFLGIQSPSKLPPTTSLLLLVFGIASAVYRTILIASIALMIASKFLWVGLLMAAHHIGSVLSSLLIGTCRYLWTSDEIAEVRGRAFACSLLLLCGVPALLLFCPVPGSVDTRGVVSYEQEEIVRTKHPGYLRTVHVEDGERVLTNARLFEFTNHSLHDEQRVAQVAHIAARQRWIMLAASDASSAARQYQLVSTRQLESSIDDLASLTITASHCGQVVESVAPNDIGNFFSADDVVAVVVDGNLVVRALATAEQMTNIALEIGQTARCHFDSAPGKEYLVVIQAISPRGSEMIEHPSLTHLAGGLIPVDTETGLTGEPYFEITLCLRTTPDPVPIYGSTCTVRFDRDHESLANFLRRKVQRFASENASQ